MPISGHRDCLADFRRQFYRSLPLRADAFHLTGPHPEPAFDVWDSGYELRGLGTIAIALVIRPAKSPKLAGTTTVLPCSTSE